MKLTDIILLESTNHSELKQHVAQIAQRVYDSWDEENVDEFAGGGICHLIADAVAEYLNDQHIEATTVSAHIGEVHVYVVAKFNDGVYEVDIPPYVYERGGGYSWAKIPDVVFDASDVNISRLDSDPESFENYIEEY